MKYALSLLPALVLTCMHAAAADLKALDDLALSDVRGQDGVSFGVNLNANIGAVTLSATDTAANPGAIALNNVLVTGTVASTLDIVAGAAGTPSYINWAYPTLNGANNLQFGFDLAVTANGSTLGTGVQFQNLAFSGTSLQLTPSVSGGVNFGLALNVGIGDVLLQPNGRGITTGQMDVNGVTISAAGSNGAAAWMLSNITTQPGILNIVTDASGTPNIQLGIGWASTPGSAPAGSLQVNNITFNTPGGNVSLGASSIGSIQIQYMNIRFKT